MFGPKTETRTVSCFPNKWRIIGDFIIMADYDTKVASLCVTHKVAVCVRSRSVYSVCQSNPICPLARHKRRQCCHRDDEWGAKLHYTRHAFSAKSKCCCLANWTSAHRTPHWTWCEFSSVLLDLSSGTLYVRVVPTRTSCTFAHGSCTLCTGFLM